LSLGRARLVRLLDEHGLRPSRALGQNFLADPNTARRIVATAGVRPGDRVVEVGAGLGSLTLPLAGAGARVTAIEMDRRLAAVLRRQTEGLDVSVVEADALRADWGALLAGHGWLMVSNLPYNVATPLVIGILEEVDAIGRMLVMVQREVGERMAARVGDDAYGAVSVKVAYWAESALQGRVPPTVFIPRPAVESVLVSIRRRPSPAVGHDVAAYGDIVALVNAGFGQRRKMLRRSLAGRAGPADFADAGVAADARAEDLTVEDWGRLAAVLSQR
jgi:16S rRNA (adenine1518-N6/adenine1519-N6)-dimethyltransferase